MTDTQQTIGDAIEDAEEIELSIMDTQGQKPRLRIENWNPHHAVTALRDILSGAQDVFDRGVPVRLAYDAIHGGVAAQALTPELLGMIAHTVCRPYAVKQRDQTEADARLPRWLAVTYLEWRGEWQLPPLNGITSAPLLRNDGAISSGEGYDPLSGMWLEKIPDLTQIVPAQPTRDDAAAALRLIRETFRRSASRTLKRCIVAVRVSRRWTSTRHLARMNRRS